MDASKEDNELQAIRNVIRQRQYRRRQPKKIGDAVANVMARCGYGQLEKRAACVNAWKEAAGERMARHSCPGNVRRGVLEVTVRNSAVMQELTFQQTTLLEQLGRLLPDEKIRKIKYRVGPMD